MHTIVVYAFVLGVVASFGAWGLFHSVRRAVSPRPRHAAPASPRAEKVLLQEVSQ